MYAHLMCMKLAFLAPTVHLPRINITKHILFTLERDATLMRCPVSEDETEHTRIMKGVARMTSR